MARAIPVLPDDDSTSVAPGVSRPSFSASSTMALAARSFTDPPGFWPSSLAQMRTLGLGESADTSTSGVLPIRSRTDEYAATSAPGDGRQDGHLAPLADLGVQAVEVAHVVVVHVH